MAAFYSKIKNNDKLNVYWLYIPENLESSLLLWIKLKYNKKTKALYSFQKFKKGKYILCQINSWEIKTRLVSWLNKHVLSVYVVAML